MNYLIALLNKNFVMLMHPSFGIRWGLFDSLRREVNYNA